MRKPRDLTGQKFGRLTALSPTDERKANCVVWKCLCECGNTAFIRSDKLTKGLTKSCGCLRSESVSKRQSVDITGVRFGRLVAECPTDRRTEDGRVIWQCQCDCGKKAYAAIGNLRKGHVRSCGCLNRESLASRAKDLAGQRFGKLVALEATPQREKRSVVWICKCDCGRTAYVPTNQLRSGNITSCGCKRGR